MQPKMLAMVTEAAMFPAANPLIPLPDSSAWGSSPAKAVLDERVNPTARAISQTLVFFAATRNVLSAGFSVGGFMPFGRFLSTITQSAVTATRAISAITYAWRTESYSSPTACETTIPRQDTA